MTSSDGTPMYGKRGTKDYFWGGRNDFPLKLLFFAIASGAIVTALVACSCDRSFGPLQVGQRPDGLILVTLAWCLCLYQSLGAQVGLKLGHSNLGTVAVQTQARIVNNQLEWAPVFLSSLWICGLWFQYDLAVKMGACYVFYRFTYGLAYSFHGHFTVLVEFATQPQYVCFLMMQLTILEEIFSFPLTSRLMVSDSFAINVAVQALFGFFLCPFNMMILWNFPTGQTLASWNNAVNPVPPKDNK